MPDPTVTRLLLVCHAQSSPHRDVPEVDWPLSATGERQAQQLVKVLQRFPISGIFASPYRRAIETVRPFAMTSGLLIHIESDIRERRLSSDWVDDFEAATATIHGDTHGRLPGGESAHEALVRFERGLGSIAARSAGETVAVATHGAVIAHLMRRDHDGLPADYHRRICNPHVFEIHWSEARTWVQEITLDGAPGVGLWRSA